MNFDIGLKGRSLLRVSDLSDGELHLSVDLAAKLKSRRAGGERGGLLAHKSIAMIFEKLSTRTRCAFAVAIADEGGHGEVLSRKDIHLGAKESVEDTAQVLGRMFDGIMYRGFSQSLVESLSRHSGIPVWNGLTDESHPTQALADLLTIREAFGGLRGRRVVYVGDGRNNVAISLMVACAKSGMHFVNCTPESLAPDAASLRWCSERSSLNGGSISVVHDPHEAVKDADVVYTDVWVSMGEEDKQAERLALLRPYQVNMALMEATGNLKAGGCIFLHCLPAFHDERTEVTRELGPLEVTDEVFRAPFSRVFDQAENRMHTIKAAMVASIG